MMYSIDLTVSVTLIVDAADHDAAVARITHDNIMRAVRLGDYFVDDAEITEFDVVEAEEGE